MAISARKLGKTFAWTVGILGVAGLSGALGMLAVVYGMVYFGDDSSLKKSTILARINEETNIYMNDGETQIGSFFDSAHRRYVPIEEIPADMINAIIAAEDKNFYNHVGIDVPAIVSAGIDYLKTGRMRGASTLTQQTVRNILGWWEVSLSRKFREWIAALQLERLYSKPQILEFYLNQFYVSGNGNGIGIAARYYFNKDVRDLSLVESAFIAGSVKGPSAYDPFIKFTREKRERAIENAFHRKNYVLRRMLEQGWITEERFKEAWDAPVKFNRGRFRSDEVALVHLIREQMNRKEILDILHIDDPRELSNAGFKIHTTIDADLQVGAQQAVRRNLSRLETILSGFAPEKPDLFKKLRSLTVNEFYFGQVLEKREGKEPSLRLTFGDLPHCDVPYDSLMRYAKWLDMPTGRTWQKELDLMWKKINIGDVLYVEVKEYHPDTHDGICELNKRPRINGGMVALDKGEVRAVVSGFDTKGFNRAIYARRQPGSVFKPLVYFAAMQLGWSMLDRVDNERQVFPYQGQFYYPRPDHETPYRETSMLWAGVMSENLASVALTARLVEKLNFDQFKQLLGLLDFSPLPGELPRDYHYRVARATGVQLDNEGVKEFQLRNAVADLLLDIQYTSTYEYQQQLEKMWWGRGYASEINNVLVNDDGSASAKVTKVKLLTNNFARFGILDAQLVADWATIQSAVSQKGAEEAFRDPEVQRVITRFRVLPGLSKPGLGYFVTLDNERPSRSFKDAGEIERLLNPNGRPVNAMDLQAIWAGSALFGSADIGLNDVQLNGWLQHGHFTLLSSYVENHYNEVMARQEEYDLHRYWQHHDFRIAVGLNFLVHLSKAMGITSKLEPVLSFPLGANDVSVAEVARAYQTFISGKTYRFYQEGPPNQINFIKRIEDRYGNVLLEPKAREHQLVPKEFAVQMREILYRIVTHGTGRRARSELFLTLDQANVAAKDKKASNKIVRIPAFGKTGTTNDYNNSNFAGFIPYPVKKGEPLDPENSYVLAAYVGYDFNKTMQNGFIKIGGAQGALPAWIGLAKEIIEKKKYIDMIDPLDINLTQRQEWVMTYDQSATPVAVDMPRGVVLDRGAGGTGLDQESIALADSAVEGESRFDEFRANVVQTTVRLPLESGGGALRIFSPFKPEDPDAKAQFPSASKITTQQGSSAPRANQQSDVYNYDEAGNRVDSAGSDAAASQAQQPSTTAAPTASSTQPVTNVQNPPAAQPAAPAPVTPSAPSSEKSDPEDWESVNPDDVFKDMSGSNAPAKKVPSANDADSEEGFVEEELW